jgi:hypothetical protein
VWGGERGPCRQGRRLLSTPEILDRYVLAQPLERIECFRDTLRQIDQRWENRFILERESLVEAYQEGRFEIMLYGKLLGTGNQTGWALRIEKAGLKGKARSTILENDKALHERDGRRYDKLVMLINSIQQMQVIEPRTLPVTARLYFVNDQFFSTGESLLYRVESGFVRYKFLEFSPKGKVKEVVVASALARQAGRKMVEGGPQIVDSIPDDEGNVIWDWLDRIENSGVDRLPLIVLHENFVESPFTKRL